MKVKLVLSSNYHIHSTEQFLTVYKHAQQVPTEKYEYPQTEAQEYGWMTQPLVRTYVLNFVSFIVSYCILFMR